jgi:acyl-coenzyme A synthetase/AMP-(fatty) acid ligase
VAAAAVVGDADERAGERPKAYVVRANGAAVDADDILRHVAERVAPHKRVWEVAFVDAIPTSPAGKILRRLLPGRHTGSTENPGRPAG